MVIATHFFKNTRDNFTYDHHQMVNIEIRLSTFFVVKDGEAIYSEQKQDLELTVAQIHQLLIAKSRLKLKKSEKTTRPVRYKLNQMPYKYTVKMTNGFKGLNLVNRVPEELWTEVHNIVQEKGNKIIPPSKKKKKRRRRNACRQSGCLRRL